MSTEAQAEASAPSTLTEPPSSSTDANPLSVIPTNDEPSPSTPTPTPKSGKGKQKQPKQQQQQPALNVIFTLDILRIVNTARTQNGLKHSDYLRYRKYCSKRLQRIRDGLHFHHGKRYQKKLITAETIKDPRHFQLLLVSAERAWSYAMQLKVEGSQNRTSTQQPRSHFHVLRRLKKAVIYSNLLTNLTSEKADSRTSLEAEAYFCWMSGNLLLEQEHWRASLEQFVRSSKIYESLAQVGDQEQKDICKIRVQEIDPSIRFCKYNLIGETGQDSSSIIDMVMQSKEDLLTSKLQQVLEDSRKKQVTSLREFDWRGRTLTIKNDKLRAAMLRLSDALYQLETESSSEKKLEKYDRLLICYNDCLRIAKEEITTHEKVKAEAALANAQAVQNYFNYQKLEHVINRNQLLVANYQKNLSRDKEKKSKDKEKPSRPDDLVRIFETLIQNVTDLDALRDKNDMEQIKSTAATLLTFKSFRCYYLALSYSFASKWGEALALLDKSVKHVDVATEHHKSCASPNKTELEKLDQLKELVRSERSMIAARHLLEKDRVSETKASANILENLQVYDPSIVESKHLIDFPPEFQAIHCKPLLFDLALTGCQFPSLDSRAKSSKWFSFW